MSGPLAAFVEESYQDALSLMTDLRDYLASVQSQSEDAADPMQRARIISEISSITRHMTEVMAWLLLQKAANAGEITALEASDRADGLMETGEPPNGASPDARSLPIEVRSYIDRSRRLYDQVVHLRGMAEREAG